jgi:hypothetical protein
LKASCRIALSDLTHAKDNDLVGICQNVYDAVNPYVANMAAYGATTGSLAALQTAISSFAGLIGTPRSLRTVSIDATIDIDQHLKAAKAVLTDQLDALLVQYQTSNSHFHNQYTAARVILNIGRRKTVILQGIVYSGSTNVILAGALVKITGAAEHEKFSKVNGSYKFSRLHIGTYVITISKAGFVTQSKTLVVVQNGTIGTDFVMVVNGGGIVTPPNNPQ